jgi:hypothetical protein
MTPDEIDAFLSSQRVCRVATIGARDRPHVAPLWFVWDGSATQLALEPTTTAISRGASAGRDGRTSSPLGRAVPHQARGHSVMEQHPLAPTLVSETSTNLVTPTNDCCYPGPVAVRGGERRGRGPRPRSGRSRPSSSRKRAKGPQKRGKPRPRQRSPVETIGVDQRIARANERRFVR